ncbi:hypothetical protein SBOR_9233 [Sclerotinia borealis F-4128]|uniref:Uncharacterized protein n=1 Tax=Sclerotinia borealis (strain F-4128) TaxID=1432307 RepID=W9C3D9_SCLBF|nr:hypothetical protein SBOR_9233 [Sclerotinia borealis F-4128]
MPTPAETPPLDPSFSRDIHIHTDSSSIDSESSHINRIQNTPTHAPLTILSSSAMNMPHLAMDSSLLKSSTGTIRSVPSDDSRSGTTSQDDSPTAQPQSQSDSTISTTPSKNSYNYTNGSRPPLSRPSGMGMPRGVVRSISTEFGPTKYSSSNLHVVEDMPANDSEDFNSAIGKANLGKSGRVIERLTKENDMLKRDVKIERLRAEEALDQARLAESRYAQENEEWERKLRDAAMNSTVLKRRERQLADAKEKADAERHKAEKATESELFWKTEMEKLEKECTAKVEEALSRAELYEGRNNIMTNHWKDQEKQANQKVAKLQKEITIIVKERSADDEKINMLKRLAEQQADQLKTLQEEKDAVDLKYEDYKTEKEESLVAIKENAKKQEKASEEILAEAQKVLGELKWALNVKNDTKDCIALEKQDTIVLSALLYTRHYGFGLSVSDIPSSLFSFDNIAGTAVLPDEDKLKPAAEIVSKMSVNNQRSGGHSSSATDLFSDSENTWDLGTLARCGISTAIIGSEWHFKPAGVMEVEKRFAEKRDRMRAEGYIQWRDHDHNFQLSSERHLVPLLEELNRITKAIVVEEGGDREPDSEDDDDEGDTYSDLSTEFQSNVIEKVALYEPLQHTRLPNPNTDGVFYPDIIKKYDYRGIWFYSDGSSMDKILKLAIVWELEAMTDSKIVKSPSESKVYIGSDQKGSVDLVIAKLENIAKYSLTNTSFHHIFYAEEIDSCKFVIKAFPEIKKKFLETTLLEMMPSAEYLSERLTVRACPWNTVKVSYLPVKIGKYTAAVQSPGTQVAATKSWAGFVWKARGTPADDPVNYFPNGYAKEIERQENGEGNPKGEDVSSTHVDIEGWVANASTTADPSQRSNIEEWRGTIGMPLNSLARLAMASGLETNMPNGKTNTEGWKGVIHQEPATNLEMLLSPVERLSMLAESATNILEGDLSPYGSTGGNSFLQSSLLDSALDAELKNSDWNALRNNASENALIDVSSSPTRSPNLKIFDMSNSSNAWGAHQFTALEPPALSSSLRMLERPKLPSEELDDLMTATSASMGGPTSNPGNELLDLTAFPELPGVSGSSNPYLMSVGWPRLSPAPSVEFSGSNPIKENRSQQPRRKLEDEMSTRVFHKTMGQKASSNKQAAPKRNSVPEPQESFLRDVAGMFGGLMAPVRGFHGKVKVHLNFDHLTRSISPGICAHRPRSKSDQEMDLSFFFTEIVTKLEADAIFLSNLENKEGSRLWSEKSTEWKVTYEFMCEELPTKKIFTIEIDAETFETHIVVLRKFGEIEVHGTVRHWDLKLAVEGIEDEEEIRDNWPGYDNLATEIQRTLYIPPGNEKPNHALKIPKQITERFLIHQLKIRKTRTFDSLDRKSKLHITEVDKSCGHELLVKDQGMFVYIFQEEKKDLDMEINWQEVSITSVVMNDLLQQNMKLELGEEASWTLQDLAVKKVSNTFIHPACVMLAQMDGVGFYNDIQDIKA